MTDEGVKRGRGTIAIALGIACVWVAFVGISRCCSGSAATSHQSIASSLKDFWGYSPFISLQAIPLVLYWRVHLSLRQSSLSAALMVGAFAWIYWLNPFAMRTPGPLLGLVYPYAAFWLTIAQVPSLIWKSHARTPNDAIARPPARPDIPA